MHSLKKFLCEVCGPLFESKAACGVKKGLSSPGKAAMASVVTERLLLREWDLGRDLGPFGAICRDADVMRFIDDG